MSKMIDELIHQGVMYHNSSSPRVSALHIFRKAVLSEWGFTVELILVIKFTVLYRFPMLVIEHELQKTAKSTKFAGVEFTQSYCLLLLVVESRFCESFMTPDGIFTMTRVTHDTTNAFLLL